MASYSAATEKRIGMLASTFALLAIFISCIGLFGMASFMAEQRTKEIGIRKVLGASETQITLLLSGNFTRLIVISFMIVSPATYWILSVWLENFAFRISINPMVFLAGGVLALVIALLTISYHTLRSARANPVNALRYE